MPAGAHPPGRADRTRAAVIRSATELFRTQGFDATRTAEVAARADVSEGTVFLHYGSKAGLLVGVFEAYYDELVAEVTELAHRPGAPRARLRRLVRFWLERIDRDWALIRVIMPRVRYADDPDLAARFVDSNRRVTRVFAAVLEELRDARKLPATQPAYLVRDVVFGAAEHVILGMHATGRRRNLTACADHIVALLVGGADTTQLDRIEAKLDRLLDQEDRE